MMAMYEYIFYGFCGLALIFVAVLVLALIGVAAFTVAINATFRE